MRHKQQKASVKATKALVKYLKNSLGKDIIEFFNKYQNENNYPLTRDDILKLGDQIGIENMDRYVEHFRYRYQERIHQRKINGRRKD